MKYALVTLQVTTIAISAITTTYPASSHLSNADDSVKISDVITRLVRFQEFNAWAIGIIGAILVAFLWHRWFWKND